MDSSSPLPRTNSICIHFSLFLALFLSFFVAMMGATESVVVLSRGCTAGCGAPETSCLIVAPEIAHCLGSTRDRTQTLCLAFPILPEKEVKRGVINLVKVSS